MVLEIEECYNEGDDHCYLTWTNKLYFCFSRLINMFGKKKSDVIKGMILTVLEAEHQIGEQYLKQGNICA